MEFFEELAITDAQRKPSSYGSDTWMMHLSFGRMGPICRDNVSHPLYISTLAFLDNSLLIQYVKCHYILILTHG